VLVIVVDGGERVEGSGLGCGSLFPTCAAGVIYSLNNPSVICPISSAGWHVVI